MPSSTRERLLLDRREFLKGCCATAAVGAVAGPSLLFSDPAHAAANPYDTIVHVFLRGGIDGLNLVPPVSGNDRAFYEEARPDRQSGVSGKSVAVRVDRGGRGIINKKKKQTTKK